MEPINQPVNPCACRVSNSRRSLSASQTQLAMINNRQSLDLNLVTEEGDRVTLSMNTQASVLYVSHGQIEGDDSGFDAQKGELRAGQFERDVIFSVEGDLNADERREIRKVIKTINRMMRNFVEGKIKPMMSKAGKLEDLEAIDSLELSMGYERQVMVARQSKVSVGYDQYGGAKEEPAAIASTSIIDAPRASLEAESEDVALEMALEVTSAQAPLANVLEGVDRLLKIYRIMAGQWNPLGGRIMDHVRELFDAALDQAGRSDPFAVVMTGEVDD